MCYSEKLTTADLGADFANLGLNQKELDAIQTAKALGLQTDPKGAPKADITYDEAAMLDREFRRQIDEMWTRVTRVSIIAPV